MTCDTSCAWIHKGAAGLLEAQESGMFALHLDTLTRWEAATICRTVEAAVDHILLTRADAWTLATMAHACAPIAAPAEWAAVEAAVRDWETRDPGGYRRTQQQIAANLTGPVALPAPVLAARMALAEALTGAAKGDA